MFGTGKAGPTQCKALIEHLGLKDGNALVGKTYVFFRSKERRAIELRRHLAISKLIVKIQSQVCLAAVCYGRFDPDYLSTARLQVRRLIAGKALRAWKQKRGPLREAVRNEDLESLTSILEDPSLAQYAFQEIQDARKLQLRLRERAHIAEEIENVLNLDVESNFDRYECLVERARETGLVSPFVDKCVAEIERVKAVKLCERALNSALDKADVEGIVQVILRHRAENRTLITFHSS